MKNHSCSISYTQPNNISYVAYEVVMPKMDSSDVERLLKKVGKISTSFTMKVLSTRQFRVTLPAAIVEHFLKRRPMAGDYIAFNMEYDGEKITFSGFEC
jgi:DNA phosphorothioation-dependent restriction protein DptG